jgi:hypothetical protein
MKWIALATFSLSLVNLFIVLWFIQMVRARDKGPEALRRPEATPYLGKRKGSR